MFFVVAFVRSSVPNQLKKFGRVNGASKREGEVRTFVMLSMSIARTGVTKQLKRLKRLDGKSTGNKDARTFVLIATRPSRD
jgi:hypothetical protein